MPISQQWVAFTTLLVKEIRRFMRIWTQTLLPPVMTMSLYFVIFGNLIGSRIGEMGGYSYMQFVVPGLIMMSVITNSYSNVVSSFFGSKFQHFIEELLVSPTANIVILAGFVCGGVVRGLLTGFIVTLVSLFFTSLEIHNLFVTVMVVFSTSVLFSLLGFINAVYAESFDDISIVPTFILTPLIYLGGVFYSIDMLPAFWQVVSQFNPILYVINAFRYGILGHSDINLWAAVSMIFVFIVIAAGYCMHLLNTGKGMRQ